jgi:antitoxin component YwqK of YwqJK toxin-antitoxin module
MISTNPKDDLINEIDYVQDKIHGLNICRKNNGELVYVETYVDNKQCGQTIEYKNDGSINYLSFVNDKLHGICRRSVADSLHMVEYQDGSKNGIQLSWFSNGGLKQRYFWKNGKMHGIYREWFENSVKREDSTYVDGKYHGRYREWNHLGKLVKDEERDMSKEY